MPPHCDTMDGPVVGAARQALESDNANIILPWVKKEYENELKDAFTKALAAKPNGGNAKELADLWFYEAAVRLHRQGEGADYTGLKPAGLDTGPAIPLAEKAIESKSAEPLINFLQHEIEEKLREKFGKVIALKGYDKNDVNAARQYIDSMLGFLTYSHRIHLCIEEEKTGHH